MGTLWSVTAIPYAAAVDETPRTEEGGELARRIAAAALNHDRAAESEFCRRFAPRIRLYGLRHLRNEASAADLVQEVLIIVLQKLRAGGIEEPQRIASFVLGTCRRVV